MSYESLYTAIGRIAENIDSNLGYGAAMVLVQECRIDRDQFKKVIEFGQLEGEGVNLTNLQRNARCQINKQVLHSYTEMELAMDFHVNDLHGKTIATNGWRWGEAKAKPKAKP